MRRVGPSKHDWMVNNRMVELETAHAWRLTPSEWDREPEESKAEMMALSQVQGQMRRYEDWVAEEKRKNTPPPRRKR